MTVFAANIQQLIIKELCPNKSNENHAPYMGDKLIHHHIEHGDFCVAIPQRVHNKFYKYMHFITRKESSLSIAQKKMIIRSKIKLMNRSLGLVGLFTDAFGLFTGDPTSMFFMFRAPELNVLVYDRDSDLYIYVHDEIIYDKIKKNGGTGDVWKIGYADIYTDKALQEDENGNKKWVGIGLVAKMIMRARINSETQVCLFDCWFDDPVCTEFACFH